MPVLNLKQEERTEKHEKFKKHTGHKSIVESRSKKGRDVPCIKLPGLDCVKARKQCLAQSEFHVRASTSM